MSAVVLPDARAQRAFELDALRGLALLAMVLHHLAYDLRYLFELPVFPFLESWWFYRLLQPFFIGVFLLVSGISSQFSRDNSRRGLRILLVAAAFTAVSFLISLLLQTEFYIFFNVLHLLAVGILTVALLEFAERRGNGSRTKFGTAGLVLAAIVMVFGGLVVWDQSQADVGHWLLLPLGLPPSDVPHMADYMPLLPWLGLFFAGAAIGRIVYTVRTTAFPGAPDWLRSGTVPLQWMGRHSLLIYAVHQPLIYSMLFLLRTAGVL